MKKNIYLSVVTFLAFSISTMAATIVFTSTLNPTNPIAGKLKVGDMAPNFSLKASDGKTYKLSDFKGKTVVLDFWAMWCGPCKKKMPKIQKLHDLYQKKNVEVIGMLAMNPGAEKMAKTYFTKKNYTFKLLYGNNKLTEDYGLQFLPTVIVIDKNGKIVYLTDVPNPNEFNDIKKVIAEHS